MNLKRGDIVFNHLQTKELLNKGKTGSRAKIVGGEGAFAHGSAHANSAGIKIKFNGSKTTTGKKKKTTSSSGKSKTGSGSSGSGKSGSGSGKKKTKSKSKKSALENYLNKIGKAFDFIEIKIENLTAATDLWTAKAENVHSLTSAVDDYDKALKSVGSSITANTQGYKKYKKFYESFEKQAVKKAPKTKNASKAKNQKVLKSYFKKVRNGSIDIKTISNDKIRSAVEEYKNWYDKAKQCKQQVEELTKQQQELVQTKLEKVVSYYDAMASKTSAILENYQKINDLNIAQGTDTFDNKTANLNNQIQQYQNQKNIQLQELNKYQAEYDKAKKKGILTDEQKNTYEAQIQTFRNNIADTDTAIANARKEIDQIKIDKFTRLADEAEHAATALEHTASMAEAHGDYATKQSKTDQIARNNDRAAVNVEIMKTDQELMNKVTKDSERYKELYDDWYSRREENYSLEEKNEQLRQEAIMIPLDESSRKIDKRNTRIDENNDLMNMLNQDYLNDPDTGKLTTDGKAKIALLSDNVRQGQETMADLMEQRNALYKLHDGHQIGDSTFESKLAEINKQLREAATNTNDYKNQIVELGKATMQAEVDALVKVIDKRKEALSRKKEYYDYDKNIKSQTKDLQALEAQRAALEGVEGEAAKAQRAKLDAQIADAQEQMDDTKKEHQYSMESQGYDDMTEKLQESLDKQLKSLSGSLDEQSKLISKFLKQVGDSYSDVFKKINDTAINSGLINGLSELYHSEYNSSANGKTPEQNAKDTQNKNSSVTNNVANPDTNVTGTTGITGSKVDSSKVETGNASAVSGSMKTPEQQEHNLMSFSVSPASITLAPGESKTVTVSDIVPPDGAGQSFSWYSNSLGYITMSPSGASCTITATKGDHEGTVTPVCKSANGLSVNFTVVIQLSASQKKAKSLGLNFHIGAAYTEAQLKSWSPLNNYLASKGYDVVNNPKGMEALGKKLGVITTKNSKKGKEFYKGKDGKYSKAQSNKILTALKKAGVRNGGVIDDVIPISKLNGVIQGNHDHGIATVRRDEILLKPETSDVLKQAVKISESVVKASKTKDIMTDTGDFSSYYDALIKVESGGMVDKSVLNDLKVVAKQVYDQEQANKLKEYHKIGRKPTIGK